MPFLSADTSTRTGRFPLAVVQRSSFQNSLMPPSVPEKGLYTVVEDPSMSANDESAALAAYMERSNLLHGKLMSAKSGFANTGKQGPNGWN